MRPVISINNYYQNIYITLGEAIHELIAHDREEQVDTMLAMFNKAESHSQCMDVIRRFVDIVEQEEA